MVFKSTMNALVHLDKMKKVFSEKGIDMYLNGKKTVISNQIYKEVLSKI